MSGNLGFYLVTGTILTIGSLVGFSALFLKYQRNY